MLLDLGVLDVCAILQIQTYCTKFLDNLLLNELLNPSCKCAVVGDDVASVRVYNCNMALAVNFARADQSFVNVCLPTLAGHSIPVLQSFLVRAEASLFQRACFLACDVLRFSFASFVLGSTGARLILWIRPTFGAQVAFLTAVPTNNVLACTRVLVLMLTFLLPLLPSPFPFLPFLPPPPKLSTSIGSEVLFCRNCLECDLTSAGFSVGLYSTSNLLVRDQSCTVHGKMFFQLTRNRGFKCGCLDFLTESCCRRSTRFAPLVSEEPVLPISQVLREDLAVCIDLVPRFVAEELCPFLHLEDPKDEPTVSNASRPDGAAPGTISKLSLSVNARSAT